MAESKAAPDMEALNVVVVGGACLAWRASHPR